MRRLSDQRGQATIDYVGLLAVLSVLLAGTASLTGLAPGIVNATLGQFRRALCLVGGGHCPAVAYQPCTVSSKRDAQHVAVSVLFWRLDEDHTVLREKLSDGTVRLTVTETRGGGLTGGVGGKAQLQLTSGHGIGYGREAHGAIEAVVGHGSVYVARDDHEADEILRNLRRSLRIGPLGLVRIGPHVKRPQSDFAEGGLRGLGRLGIGSKVSASLDALASGTLGASRNHDSGETTITLSATGSAYGLLSIVLGGAVSASDGQASLALKLDRRGNPIQLTLEATGSMGPGAALPVKLTRLLGMRKEGSSAGAWAQKTGSRRWEVSAQMDLRDPSVAAAWKAFAHDPTSGAAIRALGTRMREQAQLDTRTYVVDSTSTGGELELALAVKIGGELTAASDRARLLAASTRPPGGLWERRIDCVPV